MAEKTQITKPYPTKPRLKPTSLNPSKTPETNFHKSFKTHQISNLTSSITSIDFNPTPPHIFAISHSTSLSFFNINNPFSPFDPIHSISSFKDIAYSVSYRSDGSLLAAGCENGVVQVFDSKSRSRLRILKGHRSGVKLVKYPCVDRLHLFSGGDDGFVKYWDVATETCLNDLLGHKDYVRSGSCSVVDDNVFVTGGYDHTVRVWDVRVSGGSGGSLGFDHGKPVEDVVFLPSGGLVATAGGNVVKIWDLIGGGRCVGTMESHNKTVTSLCVGRVGKDSGESVEESRLLSVSLDGYMKVFDYARSKVTFSMRFPAPLMSVGVSPDGLTRVIGTSNGSLYVSKRKKGKVEESKVEDLVGFRHREGEQRRALRPSYFRYFHRAQNEKPREGEFLVLRPKKVKLAEHDKLLKKFRHRDAFVSSLRNKNPANVVAVMEELVARRMLFKCVSNLEVEELELLLSFLQKYTTNPRYSGLLMPFANKVIQMRADELQATDALRSHLRNLKGLIQEEVKVQQSLLEIQGIISPLMRIAGRR